MQVARGMWVRRVTALLLFVIALASPVRGQNPPGVTDKEVLIGSCAALEGPSSILGRQTVVGAKTYFALANARLMFVCNQPTLMMPTEEINSYKPTSGYRSGLEE